MSVVMALGGQLMELFQLQMEMNELNHYDVFINLHPPPPPKKLAAQRL
jgi:hypothetical protein